jgi:hypothetical protein
MDNNALKDNTSDNIAIATKPIKKGDAIIIEGEKLFSGEWVHDHNTLPVPNKRRQ